MLRNAITGISATNKSRLTNGRLPAGVDGRSPQARRFRDLMRGYEAEFEVASEIDRSTLRTAVTLALKNLPARLAAREMAGVC